VRGGGVSIRVERARHSEDLRAGIVVAPSGCIMKLMLRKMVDVTLSMTAIVLLAALVVFVAGHVGAVPY
jgi:hypothetical protein